MLGALYGADEVRICFVYADQPRERLLAEAVVAGAKAHGDDAWSTPKVADSEEIIKHNADVYGMVGVKSRRIFHDVMRAGAHTLYFDKGYTRQRDPNGPRGWEYWRVCIDSQHPSSYLMDKEYPIDRFETWSRELKPWREDGRQVVFAGSSEKYHDFHGLNHPTEYAQRVISRIKKASGRKVTYRPKPSWGGAEPIEGASFSGPTESINSAIKNAWCLVTHGSNSAVDAILDGIPCVILGDGAAKPISSTDLSECKEPRLASFGERIKWLAALAYSQFTTAEMASGQMWHHLRPRIVGM